MSQPGVTSQLNIPPSSFICKHAVYNTRVCVCPWLTVINNPVVVLSLLDHPRVLILIHLLVHALHLLHLQPGTRVKSAVCHKPQLIISFSPTLIFYTYEPSGTRLYAKSDPYKDFKRRYQNKIFHFNPSFLMTTNRTSASSIHFIMRNRDQGVIFPCYQHDWFSHPSHQPRLMTHLIFNLLTLFGSFKLLQGGFTPSFLFFLSSGAGHSKTTSGPIIWHREREKTYHQQQSLHLNHYDVLLLNRLLHFARA